ncbi:MAG TPA: tRNA (adenosine(37)-N6)-threonylcarbamoyltransferase complex dimerization subunit type 1 TsaB [Thermoanaerobaculia bacterium]|nr:tRNA (adenosine(37)-N6)-threonylcarbamoyltransferase complex dimerization subunit type 1 TsaB [Thermoanaerobaculia bacterium]
MILGVDTSLPLLSVALVSNEGTVGAIAIQGRESRNEKLLPSVDWLLREAGAAISDIELFAVTRGPGSFTGVRIGLAMVQGLARAIDRPICAMPTHEALAFVAEGRSRRVLVIADAGRGELYASGFDACRPVLGPILLLPAELERTAADYELTLDAGLVLSEHNVALLAARRAADLRSKGELESRSDVTPIYVRLAEAEARLQDAVRE